MTHHELERELLAAQQRFVDVFRPLSDEFVAALAACPEAGVIGPEADAARERVRTALHAASGVAPDSPIAKARAEVDRCRTALRAIGIVGSVVGIRRHI